MTKHSQAKRKIEEARDPMKMFDIKAVSDGDGRPFGGSVSTSVSWSSACYQTELISSAEIEQYKYDEMHAVRPTGIMRCPSLNG